MSTRIEIKTKCATPINLIIQNCCESLIEEIISFDTGGLPPIGAFLDDEGNCWTLVDTTEDPITSIRKISDSYGSCVTCLNDNPCPENYVVESCCAIFTTIFSSTLPGVGVGDTFADTFGFCWTITGTNTGVGTHPPTGKRANSNGFSIIFFAEGKLTGEWIAYSDLTWVKQLGFTMTPPWIAEE